LIGHPLLKFFHSLSIIFFNKKIKIFFFSSWEVYAGSHDLSLGSEAHRVVVKTTESIVHPDWNPSTLANDIALIKLPERIEFADGN
jgi:hypothetical protein